MNVPLQSMTPFLINPLEAQLTEFGVSDVSRASLVQQRSSSVGPRSIALASPLRQKAVVIEDQSDGAQLSFLEKKLIERSRFRNLESTLKSVQRRWEQPESPNPNAQLTNKFNPFDTAGRTVFQNRSQST